MTSNKYANAIVLAREMVLSGAGVSPAGFGSFLILLCCSVGDQSRRQDASAKKSKSNELLVGLDSCSDCEFACGNFFAALELYGF